MVELKSKLLDVDKIEETKKEIIKLSFVQKTPSVMDSKLGGAPYWEDGIDFPVDKYNNPMFLMAQINFALFPQLDDYPKEGILQFFISSKDEMYGLNFDDQFLQDNFRMVFWENPLLSKVFAPKESEGVDGCWLPINAEIMLSGEKVGDYFGACDKYHNNVLFEPDEEIDSDISEAIYDEDIISGAGSKIGGYAFFTQEDPRPYIQMEQDKHANETDNPWVLLLQLDSDSAYWDHNVGMMWGDSGVANLFIRRNDLINKDFSRVMYNWDCC